jgi:hypothetical protein
MRRFLTLVAIVVSGSAQAYSWGFLQYFAIWRAVCPPAQGRSPASIAQAMLDAHNAIRARMGVPALVWSDQLAQVAQHWANYLIATGGFSHRPNNRYGENFYSLFRAIASPALVVGYWGQRGGGIRESRPAAMPGPLPRC